MIHTKIRYRYIRHFVFAVTIIACALHPVAAYADVTSFRNQNDVLYSGDDTCTSGSGTTASTGDGGGCGSPTDSEANKKQVWSFLKSKGLTDAGAAGIMGNMDQESHFLPGADNSKTMGFSDSTGRGCRGIVQWCGDRNTKLDSFASERGKPWDCLGLQLEYMWWEITETDQGRVNGNGDKLEIPLPDALNGKDFSRKSQYTGSDAYKAGTIFHDYFERANTATGENLGRGERAEAIYKEFTGKEASSTDLAGSPSSGSGASCGSSTDNSPPSADCAGLVPEFKKMRDEGKINSINGTANTDADLAACGKVDNGPNCVGVTPELLRAVVGLAKDIDSKGVGPLSYANMNKGHDCDGKKHPNGKAIDLWYGKCDGSAVYTHPGCKETVSWVTSNASSYGIDQALHNPCAISGLGNDYGSCTKNGVLFYEPTEGEMIHMGVK